MTFEPLRALPSRSLARLLTPLLAGLLLGFAGVLGVQAGTFHSQEHGYQVTLAEGWIEIPESVIREFINLMQSKSSGTPINYDMAFQLDATANWFDYPYVLVQVNSYEQLNEGRQIPEDKFSEILEAMAGIQIEEVLDRELSETGKRIMEHVDQLEFNQPVLDREARRFVWNFEMHVQDVGPIYCMVVGHFGRHAMVQTMFYSSKQDWEQYGDIRQRLLDSFRFDPDHAYAPATDPAADNTFADPK